MTTQIDLDDAIELMPVNEALEVMQNVRMILGTRRGTVPIDREFGIDGSMVDAPLGATHALLTAELTETIRRIEPRAQLLRLDLKVEPISGVIKPLVTIAIKEAVR